MGESIHYGARGDVTEPLIALHTGDMGLGVDPTIYESVLQQLGGPLIYPTRREVAATCATISDHYRRQRGWDVNPDRIWLGSNCLAQSSAALNVLVEPGSVVAIQTPHFSYLVRSIEDAGGRVVRFGFDPEGSAPLDQLEQIFLEQRVAGVYLVNPHNPSGTIWPTWALAWLADRAADAGAWVISNELHSRACPTGTFVPFPAVSAAAEAVSIVMAGPSKSHNLAGLGGSFAAWGASSLLHDVREKVGLALSEATSVQQAALRPAYREDSPWFLETWAGVRDAQRTWVRELCRTGAVSVRVPKATGFLWLDLSESPGSTDAAGYLLDRAELVTAPGPAFGAGPHQTRVTLTAEPAVLDVALERLVNCVAG